MYLPTFEVATLFSSCRLTTRCTSRHPSLFRPPDTRRVWESLERAVLDQSLVLDETVVQRRVDGMAEVESAPTRFIPNGWDHTLHGREALRVRWSLGYFGFYAL